MKRRRTCADCLRELPETAANFYAKGRSVIDGRQLWDSYCRPCRRRRTREWKQQAQKDPVKAERIRSSRGEPLHGEAQRRANRRYWIKLKASKRRYARHKRRQREYRRRRRNELLPAQRIRPDRAGKRLVSTALDSYRPPEEYRGAWLEAEPIADWLRREFGTWPITQLAAYLDADEATLRRLISGEHRRVSLPVADRIFTAAACPHLLELLYPQEAA